MKRNTRDPQEAEKDFLLQRNLLTLDFASCSKDISSFFRCEIANAQLYTSSASACKGQKSQMYWCIMTSFCPIEGESLQACMGGDYPGKNSSKVPFKCRKQWREYDGCLVRKTEEFAANKANHSQLPSEP